MKDCWKILKIDKTSDIERIKRAYRELIKRYHPDTVHSPENIRKYTIKCVEIIEAYKLASEYAKSYRDTVEPVLTKKTPPQTYQPSPSIRETRKTSPRKQSNPIFGVFAVGKWIIVWISLLGLCVLSFLEMSGLYPWLTPFSDWVNSLFLKNPIRMMVSGLSAVLAGLVLSWGLIISTFLILVIFWVPIHGSKYEGYIKRYIFKIGFVILTVLGFFVFYYADLHWPFKDSNNAYYVLLYHGCRFIGCFSAPLGVLVYWSRDIIKYRRIKESFSIADSD